VRDETPPPRRESPLGASLLARDAGSTGAWSAVIDAPEVRVVERPFRSHLILRTRDPDSLGPAVTAAWGLELPTQPNATRPGPAGRVVWLRPTEWLVMLEPEPAGDARAQVPRSPVPLPAHVIDVSSGQTVIEVGGTCSAELLSAGCMLDLHPRAFPVHRAAQTLIGKAAVTLVLADSSPTFEVVVRRSYAPYLWRWLRRAVQGLG
jgi:sarcosine oxidase, subunit gamma